MLTETRFIPPPEELDTLSQVLCSVVSEIEQVLFNVQQLAKLEREGSEQSLPEVDAATAWHFHDLAAFVLTTSITLTGMANDLEAEIDWLYHEGGKGSRLTKDEKRDYYARLRDWFEQKARELPRDGDV